MKPRNIAFIVVLICVLSSGALLMDISQRVQKAERAIARHDAKIAKEKEKIRVFNAEWAYLNTPERLEHLISTIKIDQPANAQRMVTDFNDLLAPLDVNTPNSGKEELKIPRPPSKMMRATAPIAQEISSSLTPAVAAIKHRGGE